MTNPIDPARVDAALDAYAAADMHPRHWREFHPTAVASFRAGMAHAIAAADAIKPVATDHEPASQSSVIAWAAMVEQITLRVGQVWKPKNHCIPPREISVCFVDATYTDWVRWIFPESSDYGDAIPVVSFRAWIRETDATLKEITDAR